MLTEGEGVRATLLVQNGTLHRGDVIVCGATSGRARAMYDDLGRPIQEAGPSVPVQITGLDEVPNADDRFHVVPELTVAREIADQRLERLQEASLFKRAPASLEMLSEFKIAELKAGVTEQTRFSSVEMPRKYRIDTGDLLFSWSGNPDTSIDIVPLSVCTCLLLASRPRNKSARVADLAGSNTWSTGRFRVFLMQLA